MTLSIQHDRTKHQFKAFVENELCYLDYSLTDDPKIWDYYHTFVPPSLRGLKIAQQLVIYALNYAKENDLKIIPSCQYVKRFVEKHAEYQSLISKAD